uniref:Fibronectin type-III domain-containing protein n=1 Tax=Salvator merianae TaxID=96440 RepID=A0A8D0BVC5_SALMN
MAPAAAAGGLGARGRPGTAQLSVRLVALVVVFCCCFVRAVAASVSGIQLEQPDPSAINQVLKEELCLWELSWPPVKGRKGCTPDYHTAINTGGEWLEKTWSDTPSRSQVVPLGQEVVFGVKNLCHGSNASLGQWVTIPLQQSGKAGTGAVNLNCTWHNKEYVVCSWQRGGNASTDTVYNLTYRYNKEKEKLCTNYTKEGDIFHCTFDLKVFWINITVSVQGSSRDVRPVCLSNKFGKPSFLAKLNPPSNIRVIKSEAGAILKWSPPNFGGICYEIEITNHETNKIEYQWKWEANGSIELRLRPNVHHSFRMRALSDIQGNGNCTSDHSVWSDWSEKVELSESDKTFIILYISILLFVVCLTIILVVYLKRIKLAFLPTIPNPEKFLKHMLEDQSEDLQKHPTTEEPVKEEQTHLLEFL